MDNQTLPRPYWHPETKRFWYMSEIDRFHQKSLGDILRAFKAEASFKPRELTLSEVETVLALDEALRALGVEVDEETFRGLVDTGLKARGKTHA